MNKLGAYAFPAFIIWNPGMNYETTMSATLNGEIMQDNRDRNQRRVRIAAIIVARPASQTRPDMTASAPP
jgi:hypothetical protein